MDRQESVDFDLDWEVIEAQAELYDMGHITPVSVRAKMLEAAYRDGYAQCETDHNVMIEQMEILLTRTEGNA